MKAIKLLVLLVILVAIVVVGGIIGFVAFSDPNDFKDYIAEKVKAETGRTLTIPGDLEWGFWPKLRLKTGALSLSNAAGFSDQPFLAVKEIQVAVATLPLLKKTIEMDAIRLYGMEIHLEKNADGATNWDDFAKGETKKSTGSRGMASVALGGVDIQDAKISWRDAGSGQDVRISKLNASTGGLTFGEPIAFKLSLNAVANQPAIDGDASLEGTVAYDMGDEHYRIEPLTLDMLLRGKNLPGGKASIKGGAIVDVNLDRGTASIDGLAIEGLGTKITGALAASDIESERPSAKGRLELDGQDLALLFEVLELPVAKQLGKVKERAFQFGTDFDANMDSGDVTVSKFEGRVLGATLSGRFDAKQANTDKAKATGSLNAQGPDLPSLLAVLGQLQGADSKTLESLDKALAQTRDKSFSVQTELDADLSNGRVDLPKLSAKILGNDITGAVQATNAGSGKPAVKGQLKASGPDLPSLIAVAAVFQQNAFMRDMAQSLASTTDKAFTIETTFDTDMKQGRIDLPKLAATGLGLTIDGKLKGQDIESPKGSIEGHLAIKGDRPGPLLTAAGQKGLADAIKTIELDAGLSGSTSDLTLSPLVLTAQVAGAGVKQAIPLKLTAGSARANLDKETLAVKDLSLTGLGINAKGNLEATQIKKDPAYSGGLTVPAFNLRSVLNSLNQKIPAMADNQALTSVGLVTGFKGTTKNIALSGLDLKLDQTTMKGDLAIADFKGPDMSFSLDIDALNADRYLPPNSAGKTPPVTPEAAAGAATQLPVETLRALKVKGDLLIGKLQISGAKMQNVRFSINASDGNIQVNPVGAELYQGKYTGIIGLNATQKTPTLSINTTLSHVNVEPLIIDTTGDNKLAGIVDFNATMNTLGGNTDLLKRSLSGQGTFGAKDGIFRGVDAIAILRAAEQIIETKRPVNIPKGGETRFQTLTGTLNANNGVLTVNDLVLDGSGFKVQGKGILADLQNNKVKYDMTVAVDEQAKGEVKYNLGGYTIPIACRGDIANPSCLPDFGQLLEKMVKDAATKEIKKKLDDAIGDKASEALKKLFKF